MWGISTILKSEKFGGNSLCQFMHLGSWLAADASYLYDKAFQMSSGSPADCDMLLISEDWSLLTNRVKYKCSIFKSSFLLFVITSSHLLRPLTIPSVKAAEDESQTIMNTINFLLWDDEADLFPLKTQKPQEESRIWTTPGPSPTWSGCDVLIWPLLDPTMGLPCHPLGPHTLGIILASLFNTTPHL